MPCMQVLSTLPDHHCITVLREAAIATANFPPLRLQCLLRHLAPEHHPVILQACQPGGSLSISPSAHRCRAAAAAACCLPLLDAWLIASAAATLPPIRHLAVEHLQRGVCGERDPSHSVARSHTALSPSAASEAATVSHFNKCRPPHAGGHACDAPENPNDCPVPTLVACLYALPHLASLTSLSLSDVDIGCCAAKVAPPSTESPALSCFQSQEAQHAQHAAAQALAWALQQCCELQELTLRRLNLGTPQHAQHAQHIINAAIRSLTQLRRITLEGVSQSPRAMDAQHAQHAGDRSAVAGMTSRASAATLHGGVSALGALTELAVADEDFSDDGTAGVLWAIAPLPDLRRLQLRRCSLRIGGALQSAATAPCMHAGEASAFLPSGRIPDSDQQQAMSHAQAGAERHAEGWCRGLKGPAALIVAMHAVHACAATPSRLTALELVQCSAPEVPAPAWRLARGGLACCSHESACMHACCECFGCRWLRGIEDLRVDCKGAPRAPDTVTSVWQLCALLPWMSHLVELRLCGTPLGETQAAGAAAAALRQLSMLRVLHLDDCQITSRAAFVILPAAAELQELREMSLSRNPLRAGGAAAAAMHLPRLPGLARLSVASCAMGGGGGALFADALAAMPVLQEVDLARNLVNEAVVRHLAAALRQAPALREVVVFEEFFSHMAQEALQGAAPEGCLVVFRDCCHPPSRS